MEYLVVLGRRGGSAMAAAAVNAIASARADEACRMEPSAPNTRLPNEP